MKTRVFNLVILDESGSMEYIKPATINNVNETFQTIRNAQKKHPDQEHFISFVTFNSESIKTIYNCEKIEAIKEIDDNIYQPDSSTPLYDAMGSAITKLRKKVAADDKILVTIVTDGMENASTEYNHTMIKHLIEELKTQNWVFVYMGANHDVESVAENLSIHNHMVFEASEDGMEYCTQKVNAGRERFYDRIDCCQYATPVNEDCSFFDEDI